MATECIATCAALTAGSGARDTRCILYTCAATSGHTYAKVSSGLNVAFAQLRWKETGSTLSLGLQEALEVNELQNQVSVQVESAAEGGNESAGCKCRCGVVASVGLQFLDRPRPRSAVVQGLQRIAAQLLDGVVVWQGRRSSVNWLNCRDRVEFVDVKCGSTGSGCCHQLGTISSTSNVSLTFAGSPVVLKDGLTFELVDTYVERIARELGGVEKYAKCLLQSIVQRLGMQKEKEGTLQPSVGALVSGLPGVGKTALSREICKCLGVTTIFLNAADIFQTYVGQSEQQLVKIFESAVLQSPSILLIDGIEAIAGSRRALTDSQSTLEIGVLGVLLSYLEKIKSLSHRVFVLGTTTRPEEVDAAVVSNGRIDQAVRIEPPAQIERLAVLRIITKPWRSDKLGDSFLTRVSESTGGFVGADLLCLCQKALQVCLNERSTANVEYNAIVCPRHFEQALAVTNPSVLQTHHVSQKQQQPASTSIQKRNHNQASDAFSGVFGMLDAIETLRVSLIEPLGDCSRFLRFGTTPPKGILLTGPPGSGKTHLANAVAEQVRRRGLASFVSVECSDLLTKIVGDTEKALRELFDTARNAAPCVLYFDQIESIAPIRGFDTSTEQTFDRMLSMLLVEMDGFSTSRTKLQHSLTNDEARMAFLKQHVVILASTTNKELLDPAILRPGRFDVHIHIDFPDEDARYAMILQALETVPVDYSTDTALGSREALARHMAKHTAGLSAGDVNAVLREAAMASMRNDLSSTIIRMKYVLQALGEVTSTSRAVSSSPMATPLFARHDRDIDKTKHSPSIRRARGHSDQARRKSRSAASRSFE
uniref:AAA+ ATPase domain-containing protein n=1 Tax=Peronospora matthiolae TaxID=2874970 RepID=A0AAV1TYU2_9STRA